MCGIFSSGMSFAMDAAQAHQGGGGRNVGVNHLYSALPAYVFIMGGGAIVNLGYCFMRLAAGQEDFAAARSGRAGGRLLVKERRVGGDGRHHVVPAVLLSMHGARRTFRERLSYVNWMLHMSGYVLFGGIVGLALGEWAGRERQAGAPSVGGDCW